MADNEEKAFDQEDVTPEEAKNEEQGVDVQDNQEPEEVSPEEESPEPIAKVNIPVEEFDWDAYESGVDAYTKDERSKIEDVYDQTLTSVGQSEVVDGTVVRVTKREVVINIGSKSEGVIGLTEFRYNPDLKAGDTVEVYIENQEDKNGQLVLSHKRARTLRSWERINEAYDQQTVVTGFIKCRTKGGMIVDVFGIETFLPGSQIDVKPIRDYDMFVGKTMDFKVVKINQEFKNVVVSHKILIEAELEQQKKEIIAKLEKGQVLEGSVKNITSYGVFIDLGGVDGLIHITDLSWGRINHPEEIVELDQKLNVVILDFDEDKTRIALGLKQLTPHPWDSLDTELKVGDKVNGRVVVMADYGAFVEIKPGVEGLIHVSEMTWSQHLRSAQEFLSIGNEVEAVVLTLDRDERKMSLGMKQLKPDPWDKIDELYPVESKHKAKVRNFTNFGIFVEIQEGVDGLIHISDLSWTKKVNHPGEFTQIGAEIEVVVLEINKDNRRLSLGHKQLEENPWEVFETIFTIDSIHEGTVLEYVEKGAKVGLPYGVEGFATKKHMTKEDGKPAKAEEKLSFKVIDFSKEGKRIIVSHARTWEDEQRSADEGKRSEEADNVKKVTRRLKTSAEKTTLGDITGLAELKSEMEEAEKKESAKKKAAATKKAAEEAPAAEETPDANPAEETEKKKPAAKKTTAKKSEKDDKSEE